MQADLELRCVAEGIGILSKNRSIRLFFLDVGYVVGASEGRETTIVYTEHLRLGNVHGSPITIQELRRLKVIL